MFQRRELSQSIFYNGFLVLFDLSVESEQVKEKKLVLFLIIMVRFLVERLDDLNIGVGVVIINLVFEIVVFGWNGFFIKVFYGEFLRVFYDD